MDTQVCTKCGVEWPIDQFHIRNKVTGRRHRQCKGCYKTTRTQTYRAHYERNRDAYINRARSRNRRVRESLTQLVLLYLQQHPCACGETDPVVLDFHHPDPAMKEFNISEMLRDRRPWEQVLAEIQKCEVVCSNCHRRRTAAQFGWRRLTA